MELMRSNPAKVQRITFARLIDKPDKNGEP